MAVTRFLARVEDSPRGPRLAPFGSAWDLGILDARQRVVRVLVPERTVPVGTVGEFELTRDLRPAKPQITLCRLVRRVSAADLGEARLDEERAKAAAELAREWTPSRCLPQPGTPEADEYVRLQATARVAGRAGDQPAADAAAEALMRLLGEIADRQRAAAKAVAA